LYRPGDVKIRLLLVNNLTGSLNPSHFPDKLLPLWLDIKKNMSKHGPMTNYAGKAVGGAVANIMRKSCNSTGVKIAEKLYELHEKFQQEY
jgi:hypothetical protein